MVTKEQFAQLLEDAKLQTNESGKPICPMTSKTPTLNRCFGQLSARMMICETPCELICAAKLDDDKIRKYGGRSSVQGEFDPPILPNNS